MGWTLALFVALSPVSVIAQAGGSGSLQSKALGVIRSRDGAAITLTTDDGKSVQVSLAEGAKFVRIAPGSTDLKNATPITPDELQVGDRVLVRGTGSEDGKSLTASTVIVMKQSDVAAVQEQEREDWQKRGIGGLVSAVDAAAGSVRISVTSLAGKKSVLIKTSNKTVVRRYAPNSVKFDDAKVSSLAEIHPGDQLLARGKKNDDGTEFAAEEIVAGTFRNIAGTVSAVDVAGNTLTVMDLLTKKSVVVKVTPGSKLRKLPPMMAQGIAMRLKGQSPGGQSGSGNGTRQSGGGQAWAQQRPSGPGGGGGGGRGDLQQLLTRLPAMTLSDFQKGEAVILVSTEGNGADVTAITMVGGVEPILTASPGAQGMTLSPWSLSGAPGEAQ